MVDFLLYDMLVVGRRVECGELGLQLIVIEVV